MKQVPGKKTGKTLNHMENCVFPCFSTAGKPFYPSLNHMENSVFLAIFSMKDGVERIYGPCFCV